MSVCLSVLKYRNFRSPPPSPTIFSEPSFQVPKHFWSPPQNLHPHPPSPPPLVILNELSLNVSLNSFRAHHFENGRSRNAARFWSCFRLAVSSQEIKSDMKKTHHQHIPKTLENAGEFRMFIYELTESKIFSVSILFVILLNTVILVIQTDEGFSVKAGNVPSLCQLFF